MLVTPAGIVMLVSAAAFWNALLPMLASWLSDSNVTVSSDVAPPNATSPMLVTLAGMVMLVSDVASTNAKLPMLVTLAGMVMLVSDVA